MEKPIVIRERVLEIQKGRCVYCGHDFSESRATNHHRDHNQHNNKEDNVTVPCENCHRKLNTVEAIFRDASERLQQEIIYSILMVAPPSLAKELV